MIEGGLAPDCWDKQQAWKQTRLVKQMPIVKTEFATTIDEK